jgi:hypothetical protein
MTDINRSPLAQQAAGVRDPKDAPRRKPWGFLLHTTGGGVTDMAVYEKVNGKRQRRAVPLPPIEVALDVYIGAQNGDNGYLWGGPHYVIPHDGSIYQIAPDDAATAHAGGQNRLRYFSGSWESAFPSTTEEWKRVWGAKFAHPYMLFPSKSPNADYIGCEMIPCGDGFGTPMRPGLRFTKEQHDAAIKLAHDCGLRHGWPAGWMQSSRLLGHEDVDPLNRSYPSGAWDPGFLRPDPYFDFDYVRSVVELP